MSSVFNRRTLMRGLVGGAAVSVGIPMLDMFLDESGTSFADTGAKFPCALAPTSGALA